MNLEKIIQRVAELADGIAKHHGAIQQMSADLNVMIGAKAELERLVEEAKAVVHDIVDDKPAE